MTSSEEPVTAFGRPIYLHILDRELRQAVDSRASGEEVERALKVLLLSSNSSMYAGISLAYESPIMTPSLRALLGLLIQTGILDLVSHHPTFEEFIESRQALYEHDAKRYPMYFSPSVAAEGFRPSQVKTEGTTTSIEVDMRRLLEPSLGEENRDPQSQFRSAAKLGTVSDDIKAYVESGLEVRGNRAITYSLFSSLRGGPQSPSVEGSIRRLISSSYSEHYLQYGGGDIITGVRGYSAVDAELARAFPTYDYLLLDRLLQALGLRRLLIEPFLSHMTTWGAFLAQRDSYVQSSVAGGTCLLLEALTRLAGPESRVNQYRSRAALAAELASLLSETALRSALHKGRISPMALSTGVKALLDRLGRSARGELVLAELRSVPPEADVLLATATDVETRTLYQAVSLRFHRNPVNHYRAGGVLTDLGTIGGARVWSVRSGMGSYGPTGATLSIHEAILQLHPVAVILLGIAFGVDRDKQELACVLVSEQVFDYEPMKVQGVGSGPGISRGSKADASPWLIGAFRAEAMRRPPRSVQFGLFLSGAKLIDDAVFLSHLRKLAPEAIGGDMEAAGLYAAANRRNTPWIVAKAICDWADGRKAQNKEMNQRTAARASTELVLDVLERGAVTRTSAPADTQRLAL